MLQGALRIYGLILSEKWNLELIKLGLLRFIILYLENGPDPTLNVKLEHLIQRAKASNMAKDKIESAIKSGVKVALN